MTVKLIGAPTCVGTGTPGCEYGPRAVEDVLHDYEFVMLDHFEGAPSNDDNMRNYSDVMAWCGLINKEVTRTFREGKVPGLIGGDHSLAIGSISAVSMHAKKNLHVLWFDAHADINSAQTSPTGNMHGMPVQMLIRLGYLHPNQITYFGLRSVDPGEVQFLNNNRIKFYNSAECIENIQNLIQQTVNNIPDDTHIHVSFDIDFFDPTVAPGVGTPEHGGPTDIQLEWLKTVTRVNSFDVVELNPERDDGKTVDLACRIVELLSNTK